MLFFGGNIVVSIIKNFVLSLAVGAGIVGLAVSSAFAVTLNVDSFGKLLGATGVSVGGGNYNVTFIEDNCFNAYDGCDQVSKFTFQTLADARLASQALLDQVLLDTPLGSFDSQTDKVPGLDATYGYNLIVTPFALHIAGFDVEVAYAINYPSGAEFEDRISPYLTITSYDIDSDSDTFAYAKWTEVSISAVPLPTALPLYGAGLAFMGFIGWRRSRKAARI